MTNTKIAKIITLSGITLMVTGYPPFTMSRDHKLFDRLLTAVNDKDVQGVLEVINISQRIEQESKGIVTIRNGMVYIKDNDGNDEQLHDVIAERILSMHEQGIDFEYMAKFLENLMQNPSFASRQELYLFLENGDMPITEDGRFLAYKWVRSNYFDCHSGTFDNSVGKVCKMARNKVNDDRTQTCSSGLHVCTHAYTKFGDKLMVVAVNPRDVVSVPNDYDNAKMRVCEYEVMYEVSSDKYDKFDAATPVVSSSNGQSLPKRDSRGRFIKTN